MGCGKLRRLRLRPRPFVEMYDEYNEEKPRIRRRSSTPPPSR